MADPYGYVETAPAADLPSRVMWNGIIATVCAAMGMCACYIPYFIGAFLGLYAAWNANKVLQTATDERDRAMATAGLVSGLVGGLICCAWCCFVLLYAFFILAYIVVIFLAIGGAALSQ